MPGQSSQIPRPLGERLLVKVIDEQEGTIQQQPNFGPFLVMVTDDRRQQKKPKPARGFVTAVGPGTMWIRSGDSDEPTPSRQYVPMEVKVGDEVLFYSEVGVPVTVEDEDLLLVTEQAILVVLSSIRGEPAMYEGVEREEDS